MSMLWQRFTERAKRVVIAAQEEAAHAGEPYVSPEHLLLGIVKDHDSVACKALERMGVAAARVRTEIEKQIGGRSYGRLNNNDVTLDPRMKRVLDFAYDEARQSKTNYIGSEHLLLGIIREGDGPAFRTLAKLGVDIVAARREVFNSQDPQHQTAPARASFDGYVTQTFTDPTDATRWLNEMAKKDFQLRSASSSGGALWLIMSGRIEENEVPGQGEGPAAPVSRDPAAAQPADEESPTPPARPRTKRKRKE